MSLTQAWSEMMNWLRLYIGEKPAFFIITVLALLYLLIFNQSVRKTIVIPILVLVPVVINPILYKYVFRDLRYWRFFWILTEAVLIGLAFADISQRISKPWAKGLSLIAIIGVILLFGNNIFFSDDPFLQPMDSWYKVSPDVRENCDIILADNPNPKCIFQSGYVETRVYSGNIKQIHGRDIDGYIIGPSEEAVRVHNNWKGSPDEQEYIFTLAQEQGYTHICCKTTDGFDEMAERHEFTILAKTENYTIYHRQ